MKTPGEDALIFHITHLDNLASIVSAGGLWCDRQLIVRRLTNTNIGHRHIKARRMARAVRTRAGGTLGDYVPFNFCPRSVMLFRVNAGHDDYPGGQEEILHLVSSVRRATALGVPWAFTDRHADLGHSIHYDDLKQLGEVPWHVMDKRYWQDVKEERQAEFLVRDFFPWTSIFEIATMTPKVANLVGNALRAAEHQPTIQVRPNWYY